MAQELFHSWEVIPVTVSVMVQLSPPLPGGNARLEVMLERAISISHGAMGRVLVRVDQAQEALGMAPSSLELCIPCLELSG